MTRSTATFTASVAPSSASSAATVQPLEGGLRIPLGLMTPSPLNPRKRWDDPRAVARVAAMADSLRATGQVQPVRVRPNPQATPTNGRPLYELVVGETRWRAAPAAGLQVLDAMVGDYTDQQVIELALAENTQRGDLHPLEEADAYDALLRKPDGLQGYPSVAALAAQVGVSASHVYQRLKLRALCAAGRDAFLAGQIDASVALLIARMPDAAEQSRATARIVAGWGGEAYSYRQAAEYLQREYMLRLQLARFDATATYSVAGPCADCPKRSGAAPDLFADVTAGDMCQDARCYAAKTEEAHQALLQAARDAGCTVLQGSAAKAVMATPQSTPVGHYRLDAPCTALTDSQRPLRDLLGRRATAQLVVLDLPDTAPIELVPTDVATKAIKARGLLRGQASADTTTTSRTTPLAAIGSPAAAAAAAAAPPSPAAANGGAPSQGVGGTPEAPAGGGTTGSRATSRDEQQRRAFGVALAAQVMDRARSSCSMVAMPPGVLRLVAQVLAELLLVQSESPQQAEQRAQARALLQLVAGWQMASPSSARELFTVLARLDVPGLLSVLPLMLVANPLAIGLHLDDVPRDPDLAAVLAAYAIDAPAAWAEACAAVDAPAAATSAATTPTDDDATAVFLAQHGAEAHANTDTGTGTDTASDTTTASDSPTDTPTEAAP